MSNLPMDAAFASMIREPREELLDARVVREAVAVARLDAMVDRTGLRVEELSVGHAFAFASRIPSAEEVRVAVRIYRRDVRGQDARGGGVVEALPVLLYLHGGGFFCGDVASEERQCARYARDAGCAVVCVGYRLAPEHPFPAGVEDCYRVLEWLWQEGAELGLDRERIAVGGSSAGANLAAALTLMARDRGGPPIRFQMLLVPALDDRLETRSAREFTEVPDFARPEAEVMWWWYLGGRNASPYAAPARAENLAGLPTAYVLCAGLDPLRDEGLEYARRLEEAGVAVECHLVPSIPHGFASVPDAAISVRLLNEQVEVLRAAFHSFGVDRQGAAVKG